MKSFQVYVFCVCVWSFIICTGQIAKKPEDIKPLTIGKIIPIAILQDSDGKKVELQDLITQKPTVLVFYRGGWCFYCNTQLSGLSKIEQEILSLGYQIIGISPDDYRNLKPIETQDSIHYELLSDPGAKLINTVGIGFKTPLMIKGFIASKKGQKGRPTEVIPVPTVMILDKKGVIHFIYSNPDYKVRLSNEKLLDALKLKDPSL